MRAEADAASQTLLGGDGGQHGGTIGLAAGFVGGDAAGGEEVGGGDAAKEAPVGAAGSEADGAGEHELASRAFERAIGEGRV